MMNANNTIAEDGMADRYKRLPKARDAVGGLESIGSDTGEPDLSPTAVLERSNSTREQLHEIVGRYLGDQDHLHAIADQLVKEGRQSLVALGNGSLERTDGVRQYGSALEVIVRTDGSRPSFMVRDGEVDLATSPAGAWAAQIQASAASGMLQDALSCVGRIDLPGSQQGFEGTGFLIQENHIITNRHVLQVIARPDSSGDWALKTGVTINFGHEFRVADRLSPRRLKRVVFCPAKVITDPVDHAKLDLVLIELENPPADEAPRSVLAFDISPDWAAPGQYVYTVGYPANPGLGESLSLLEQLFQSTFGCKRLAPGEVLPAHAAVPGWTLAHDATTLGGNSGSVVLVPGREQVAAALHYGGTRAVPRENWAHVLGRVLDQPDMISGTTLKQCLQDAGVNLVDRRSS